MDIVTYALCKGHTDKAVDDIMDIIASMEKLTMTIVDELPSVDDAEPNVIYLIDTNHDNVYEEYVLIEIGGEKELVSLGDITDLSNYYNKIETDNLLAGKQATLTWDNVPTENSTNAVNSGVVYAAVQSVANTLANLNCVMSVTASNNVITVTYRNNTSSTITITGGIIPYDNTTSGLSATNVQSAIDEVAGVVEAEHVSLTQAQYDQLTPAEKNNGSVYFITDGESSGDFSNLENRVGALETSNQTAVHYKGTTTTAISNGSTTNPITIDGEEYTAVFGDIVVYGYTEFVFDGTAWSEFGRPFDTTPTSGSANAVTSDGIYLVTPLSRGTGDKSAYGGYSSAAGSCAFAFGYQASASKPYSIGLGLGITANQNAILACGKYNSPRSGDLFNVGNGRDASARSNIVEVNATDINVNGDIKRDGVGIDDYTTTERKIGKWIDGSDLYQRTFEVTGLVNKQWNSSVLDTSGINIIDTPSGTIHWLLNDAPIIVSSINFYRAASEFATTYINSAANDVDIYPNISDSGFTVDKAVITIKYTKPSVQANTLNANIQQTEEPTDEMR